MINRRIATLAALAGLLTFAGQARATVLAPGQHVNSGSYSNFDLATLGVAQATFTTAFVGTDASNAPVFTGTVTETIVKDASTGNLDFLFKVTSLTGDALEHITVSAFSSPTTVDVGVGTVLGVPDGMVPDSISRSSGVGKTVDFSYADNNLTNGSTTATLIVKTNRTSFDANGTISIQDGGNVRFLSLEPAPEPATMALALTALPLIGLGRWFRRRRFNY